MMLWRTVTGLKSVLFIKNRVTVEFYKNKDENVHKIRQRERKVEGERERKKGRRREREKER